MYSNISVCVNLTDRLVGSYFFKLLLCVCVCFYLLFGWFAAFGCWLGFTDANTQGHHWTANYYLPLLLYFCRCCYCCYCRYYCCLCCYYSCYCHIGGICQVLVLFSLLQNLMLFWFLIRENTACLYACIHTYIHTFTHTYIHICILYICAYCCYYETSPMTRMLYSTYNCYLFIRQCNLIIKKIQKQKEPKHYFYLLCFKKSVNLS